MINKEIYTAALECVQSFNAVLCPKVREIEMEYESQAMNVKHLGKPVDFSYYYQQWSFVTDSANKILQTVTELLKKISDGVIVESYITIGLTKLEPTVRKLLDYSSAMQKLMKRLDEKSQGKKYGYFEYRKDFKMTEQKRDIFVNYYNTYKQKLGDS